MTLTGPTSGGLASVPTGVLIAVGVLAVVELVLEVTALVVLARTPRERVQLGARWPWVLIILLVNTVGAIVFLVVGRRPAPVEQPPPAADRDEAVRRVVDDLYGDQP